jgi:hypothetical protein
MSVKSIVLAAAAVASLAVPAAAFAQPYWGGYNHDGGGWRDRGYNHDGGGWRDRGYDHDGGYRQDWREHAYWGGGPRWGYAPRCFVEYRGGYDAWGHYVGGPVRVCR